MESQQLQVVEGERSFYKPQLPNQQLSLAMQRLLLDETDQKILNLLARDGRLSYRTVAYKLGLTTKSVKARVDKMVSGKVINRFHMLVNPSIIGYKGMYMLIFQENKLSKDLIEKINLVGHIHIRHRVLGGGIGYGIAIKEGVEDKIELLLHSLAPAIMDVELHNYSPAPYEPSNTDYKIIRQLMKNPRMEILEIAKEIKISPKTVRRRLEKMEKSKVLEFTILANPSAMKGQIVFFLAVRVEKGTYKRVLEKIYSEMQDYFILPSFMSFQELIGVELAIEDVHAMESIRSRIEPLSGVKDASVFLPIEVDIYDEWIAKEIERKLAKDTQIPKVQITV